MADAMTITIKATRTYLWSHRRSRAGGRWGSAALTAAILGLALATSFHPRAALAAARPIVVELFTSQGCSSCPPADALLGELAQRPDLIALGYHVDYWDYLGWKDPLSAPGSTQRQNDYARLLDQPSVYTPQMVVEGHLQMIGSDRQAVLDGIAQAAPETAADVTFAPDRHTVTISAGQGQGQDQSQVKVEGKILLVRFQRHHDTAVAAGENAGLHARDVNGVTSLTELGPWQGPALHFTIDPPAADEGIAVLVQAQDGHMIGAGVLQ